MILLRKSPGRYTLGILIALIALFLTFLAWVMQAYSLINWEEAVSHGLQRGSFTGDALDIATATKERGEAIADLIWALPINIIAFIGLLRKKLFGFIAAMMEFAICVYFPLFYIFQLWNTDKGTLTAAVVLWGIPSLIGIIGLWTNRKLFID